MLGKTKRNIAVAQTKAELVASSSSTTTASAPCSLAAHSSTSKDQLRKTVASNAPFFPVCAPLGLGMEPLAQWIAELESPLETYVSPKLKVLRSFDINTPGTSSTDILGGVLGGTIIGSGCINIGDELEIRPGLFVDGRRMEQYKRDDKEMDTEDSKSECFKVQPLSCHTMSLTTGKTRLTKVAKGGLIAIQTDLCPSICANNGFVGAVVGPKGTLPPVWGPSLLLEDLELVQIAGSKKGKDIKDFLKKKTIVKCHVGPAAMKGEVVRVSKSKRKLKLLLKVPVVANKGAMVAIQAKNTENGNFSLVAHGRIFGGDVCLDGIDETKLYQQDSQPSPSKVTLEGNFLNVASHNGHEDNHYLSKEMLKDNVCDLDDEYLRGLFLEELELYNQKPDVLVYNSKISVPRAQVERDGGAHVCVKNFGLICLSLRRDPQHLILYLEKEGNLSCFLAAEGAAIRVKWRSPIGSFPDHFSSILKRYAKAYIVCHQCHMAQTELQKQDNKTELLCRKCNARRFV